MSYANKRRIAKLEDKAAGEQSHMSREENLEALDWAIACINYFRADIPRTKNQIPTSAEWELFAQWNKDVFGNDGLPHLREKVGEVADKPIEHQFGYRWEHGLVK